MLYLVNYPCEDGGLPYANEIAADSDSFFTRLQSQQSSQPAYWGAQAELPSQTQAQTQLLLAQAQAQAQAQMMHAQSHVQALQAQVRMLQTQDQDPAQTRAALALAKSQAEAEARALERSRHRVQTLNAIAQHGSSPTVGRSQQAACRMTGARMRRPQTGSPAPGMGQAGSSIAHAASGQASSSQLGFDPGRSHSFPSEPRAPAVPRGDSRISRLSPTNMLTSSGPSTSRLSAAQSSSRLTPTKTRELLITEV